MGDTMGAGRKSKKPEDVFDGKSSGISSYKDTPEWFKKGVEMALLAPTAMNQQFTFTISGDDEDKAWLWTIY